MTNTTKKVFITSRGAQKTIEATHELDEVFQFLCGNHGSSTQLHLSLTHDRQGANLYVLQTDPAVWCSSFPENQPRLAAVVEMSRQEYEKAAPAETEAAR